MSRRWQNHIWFRSLTALFAVWFVVATTEVTSLHDCPMHDGAMPGNMAGMTGMANHAAHGVDEGHNEQQDGAPAPHACMCLSTCCAATPPMPARADVVALVVSVRTVPQYVASVAHTPRVSWIDFVLPFANAPPMTANA